MKYFTFLYHLRLYLLILLTSLQNTLWANQEDTLFLKQDRVTIFNNKSWTVFGTADSAKSISDVQEIYKQNGFKPTNQAVFNGGIPSEYLWFHFVVTNADKTNEDFFIDIQSPRINQLELFESKSGEGISMGKTGDFYKFEERPIAEKNFIFKQQIKPGETKEYYLKVNQVGHSLILPIKIYNSRLHQRLSSLNYFFAGLLNGIFICIAFLSFVFFVSTRHILYLFYSLYIVSAVIWVFSYFGLGYQYIWGEYPFLSTIAAPFWASLNVLLNLHISQLLLNIKHKNLSIFYAGNIAKTLLLLSAFFPILFNLNEFGYFVNATYLKIFLSIILLSMFLVLVSVILYSIKGSLIARIYLFASFFKVGAIINLALLELGVAPGLYNLEFVLQAGVLVEMSLLTFTLAKRYTVFRQKSYKAVIDAQEKEKEKISKEIHDGISNSLTAIRYAILNLLNKSDFNNPGDKKDMERVADELNVVHQESRYISHYMMPDYIKQQSLSKITEKYIKTLNEKIGKSINGNLLGINFSASNETSVFPEDIKLNVFRIIQELVSNILKHSKASNADLILSFEKKGILIVLEDNGIGLPEKESQEKGAGLMNIKSRVKFLHGSMSIISPINVTKNEFISDGSVENQINTAGPGTLITIKIPFLKHKIQKIDQYDY